MSRPASEDADLLHCREMIRGGSKSFYAASLLLPRRVRDPSYALYAFCRMADDVVDEDKGDALSKSAAVRRLVARLDRAALGRPADSPVDRAFARVLAETGMPRELPDALIEGLAWDADARRYATLGDLVSYAARVAAAVGAMMCVLMKARAPEMLGWACDLGVAMQFTNIARDVGEDARAGRLYLPLDWLEEAGLDPDRLLAEPAFSPALGAVVRRLLDEADKLYLRSEIGIARLPADCRPAIFAARYLYAAIGDRVRKAGYDSVSGRAVVPMRRKLGLAARAIRASILPPLGAAREELPDLPETRFLVEAASVAAAAPGERPAGAGWIIELFTELERRDRLRTGPLAPSLSRRSETEIAHG